MGFKTQLMCLAESFNVNHVFWALGGSALLYFKGLDVSPRDLDILVDISDIERAKELVESLGGIELEDIHKGDGTYLTEKFYTFEYHGVEIDLMANPGVNKGLGPYYFAFNKMSVRESVLLENISIYLSDLSEWEQYYRFLERPSRVTQIMEYFKSLQQSIK